MHSGAVGQRRDALGHQRASTATLFEFLRDKQLQRDRPVRARGRRRQEGETTASSATSSAARSAARSSATSSSSSAGYQGTITRQTPASFVAFVPTPAMLAGDFTAIASPACNAGRQVALRAPFVNNRINPALFSQAGGDDFQAAADRRPIRAARSATACRSTTTTSRSWRSVDYQMSANHSMFGRYIDTFENRLPTLSRTGNILTVRREFGANKQARAQSTAFGDTMVFGANMVNAFRVTWNRTSNHLNDPPDEFFDAPELGIKLHTYVPGVIGLDVTNGFTDLRRQLGQGADRERVVPGGRTTCRSCAAGTRCRSAATSRTGRSTARTTPARRATSTSTARRPASALADFLTGQTSLVRHGAPGVLLMNQWYFGLLRAGHVAGHRPHHGQRRSPLGAVLRAEPPAMARSPISCSTISGRGSRRKRFLNAPAGLIYPGDPGFPDGNSGIERPSGGTSRRASAWRGTSPATAGPRSVRRTG